MYIDTIFDKEVFPWKNVKVYVGINNQGEYVLSEPEYKSKVFGNKTKEIYAINVRLKSCWKCPINHEGCKQNCGSYGCGN